MTTLDKLKIIANSNPEGCNQYQACGGSDVGYQLPYKVKVSVDAAEYNAGLAKDAEDKGETDRRRLRILHDSAEGSYREAAKQLRKEGAPKEIVEKYKSLADEHKNKLGAIGGSPTFHPRPRLIGDTKIRYIR
jgi:hypothetical protein